MRIDLAIIIQYVDELQVVALASGKVIGIVGRGDLDSSSTKAHVHQLCVLNDGYLAPVQGVHHKLAMQVLVPATDSMVSVKDSTVAVMFDSPSAKAHVHQLCSLEDEHLALVQGMNHILAVQVPVPATDSTVVVELSMAIATGWHNECDRQVLNSSGCYDLC